LSSDYSEAGGADPQDSLFYAVFTDQPGSDTPKTDPKDYVLAGVMGQISSSYADSTAEPGFIMILKPFQVSQDSMSNKVQHALVQAHEGLANA
jgi:hypothetical protein